MMPRSPSNLFFPTAAIPSFVWEDTRSPFLILGTDSGKEAIQLRANTRVREELEMQQQDWAGLDEDEDAHVWEDNWDDDNVEDDFSNQLRAELEKHGYKMETS
nr:26S proteasome complex subunit SEM1 isoform X2 [Pogona vitticeps]